MNDYVTKQQLMLSKKSKLNYYEQQNMGCERVILAESIELPKLPKEALTLRYLETHAEYKLAEREYTDVTGKFFFNVQTPLLDKEVSKEEKPSPRLTTKGGKLETSEYTSTTYITLTIPKYIVLNFRDSIPKGTEFIVTSINSKLDLDDVRIIGLY